MKTIRISCLIAQFDRINNAWAEGNESIAVRGRMNMRQDDKNLEYKRVWIYLIRKSKIRHVFLYKWWRDYLAKRRKWFSYTKNRDYQPEATWIQV